MISECQIDSIQLLKLIYNSKLILLKLIEKYKNNKEKFQKLYEDTAHNISLTNYFESITGLNTFVVQFSVATKLAKAKL